VDYLDMVLHAFPDAGDPGSAFPDHPRSPRPLGAAYQKEMARQAQAGIANTATRCGLVDIAGVTVGAAFVGTAASTLAVSDVLRRLHDGTSYAVTALDLRNPNEIKAVPSTPTAEVALPKFTLARP
jgi:hypothetical protein